MHTVVLGEVETTWKATYIQKEDLLAIFGRPCLALPLGEHLSQELREDKQDSILGVWEDLTSAPSGSRHHLHRRITVLLSRLPNPSFLLPWLKLPCFEYTPQERCRPLTPPSFDESQVSSKELRG